VEGFDINANWWFRMIVSMALSIFSRIFENVGRRPIGL